MLQPPSPPRVSRDCVLPLFRRADSRSLARARDSSGTQAEFTFDLEYFAPAEMQFVSFCLRVYEGPAAEGTPFNLSEVSVIHALPPEFMSPLAPGLAPEIGSGL